MHYVCDALRVFSHAVERSKYDPIPANVALTPPPTTRGSEVAQWTGAAWIVLPKYPEPQPPPAPVPPIVSRAQGRTALNLAGLFETVEAAVYAPGADPQLRIAYEANEWHRASPTLLALAAGLGLTEEQVDDLFRTAAEVLL